MLDYDLSNPTILEDMVDNIEENLKKNLSDFRLQELFRIRQKSKLETNDDFYIDINDHAALEHAVSRINAKFCVMYLDPKISKRLNLQDHERPLYFDSLWMIAFSYPYTVPEGELEEGKDGGQLRRPKESDTEFKKHFKTILFDKVEPLNKNIFNGNVNCLERFIKNTLGQMSYTDVVITTSRLLMFCTQVTEGISASSWNDDTERSKRMVMYNFLSVITRFLGSLVEHYNDIDDKNPFKDLWISRFGAGRLKVNTPRGLWKKYSTKECPEHLTDTAMFKNSYEDVSISLNIKGGKAVSYLMGAELKISELSLNMIPSKRFEGLSGVFREALPYMFCNDQTSYFLTDIQKTLYFEFPVEDGTWKSISNTEVKLVKAPLRYMVIDHTKNKEDGDLSFQTIIALKIYDRLRKVTNDGLGSIGVYNQNLQYHRLDRVEEFDGYRKFMKSLIKKGFKTRRRLSQRIQSSTSEISNFQEAAKASDGIGDIYPVDALMSPREYNVLEKCSNTTSTKFYLPMAECLRNFNLRYKMNSDINQNVFIKLFDIYWLKSLNGIVLDGWEDIPDEQLNGSDRNVIALIQEEPYRFKSMEKRLKFKYLREFIALRRIESWNKSHPEEKINTPKLLQHGWLTLNYPQLRTYGGPFLAFENLDFINNKQMTVKRFQSLRYQLGLLSKAGIKHNHMQSSHFCFDYNDECFIIDFGNSTVDGNEIFDRFDISDLMSPE